MKLRLAVFILVASAGSAASGQTSVMATVVGAGHDILIRSGAVPEISEYREAVVVEFAKGDLQAFCSGVLVAPQAVLTAAHCAQRDFLPVRVTTGARLNQALSLGGGDYARWPPDGIPQVQSARVASVKFMDDKSVKEGRRLRGRDLMLIGLKEPFRSPTLPIAISPLEAISPPDDPADPQDVRIVGFGEDGARVGTKLFADIQVLQVRCGAVPKHGAADCMADKEMFVASKGGKVDTCPGDSGGPVYVRNKGGQYRLIGITSRPTSSSAQCGGGSYITLLDGDRLEWILAANSAVALNIKKLEPEPAPCKAPYC